MRQAFVADRFYPGNKGELNSTLDAFFSSSPRPSNKPALGVIAPHAGYIYSGQLAAETICSVAVPETVVLLGPNHTGKGATAALSSQDWSTPLGIAPCNETFCQLLLKNSKTVTRDDEAHLYEHSLEVQLPILQKLQPALSVAALTIKHIPYPVCEEIAEALVTSIQQHRGNVLLLASTDMNHFESREVSDKKNGLALAAIKALDPQSLYNTVYRNNISMCGVIPVVITLLSTIKLGAKRAELRGYTDSGAVSGDTAQVVGYAGFIIDA